jgi:integrase
MEVPAGKFENLALEKIAAQALLTKRLVEVARGDFVSDRQRLVFSELCNRYLDSKVNIRPTTMRSYKQLIDAYLLPYFEKQRIHTITAADVERYRAELSAGLPAPIADALMHRTLASRANLSRARAKQKAARTKVGARTINKSLTVLTMIFNYAARHRWVDFNPAEHIEKLRDNRAISRRLADQNILTPNEVKRLIDAATDRWRLIIQTAVFTGMRQGELLGLQWGDIDWNSHQIHVRRAWREGSFTEPKTANSIRKVDLPEFMIAELKQWKLRCPISEHDLVFPNGSGNPESHANLMQRGFDPALRRAGLRKIRFHDLRHTFASLMLANGEDVVRVSRLLGHASPTITLNVYSHMLPKEHYGGTDRLAQLIYGRKVTIESGTSPEVLQFSKLR